MFGLLPERPAIQAYVARFNARPAVARLQAKDADLVVRQGADRGEPAGQ
jgi:glutathione S-transferase